MFQFNRNIPFLFLFSFYGHAAFEPLPAGAQINGQGQTVMGSSNDPFQFMLNPATVADCQSASAGIHYTRLFGMKELSQATCILEFKSPYGGFGLSGQTLGNSFYKETLIHACFGFAATPAFHIGGSFNVGQLTIKNYNSTSVFWFDAGLIYTFSNQLIFGVSVTNLNQARIGKTNDPVPQTSRVGFGYTPISGIRIMLETYKDIRFPLEIHCGLETIPLNALILRCGFIDNPQSISFGIGIQLNKIQTDYAFITHPVLGATHHASVIFSLKPFSTISLFPVE